MEFELPQKKSESIIKVIGVGGGGSNAVNYMFKQGITGVDFIICNTDQQALDISPVKTKIQLGPSLTEGRGAGSIPEVGKNAAIENIQELTDLLQKNTKMVFVTAGMGGGTGTGAAPIIAETAKELGILTVGIVTVPFLFEGKKRQKQADSGLEEIKKHVDTLLVINNDRLREMHGNLTMSDAFSKADDVLTTAARGIAEIITRIGYVNVDFEDVRTVMTDGGVAIMGSAAAEGENRALEAAEKALSSPLLNDNRIEGAKYVLLNISFGQKELLMDEVMEITDFIQQEAGETADIIWGYGQDESLGEAVSVTMIATGFHEQPDTPVKREPKSKPKVHVLEEVETTEASKVTDHEVSSSEEIKLSITNSEAEVKTPETPEIKSNISPDVSNSEPQLKIKESKPGFKPIEEDTEQKPQRFASEEERIRSTNERMDRLRTMSEGLRKPTFINEMERVPAYIRKKLSLGATPSSADSQISRYSINETENEDGEKKTEIRSNNSFLHDNVD